MTSKRLWTVKRSVRYFDANDAEISGVEAFILECPNDHPVVSRARPFGAAKLAGLSTARVALSTSSTDRMGPAALTDRVKDKADKAPPGGERNRVPGID